MSISTYFRPNIHQNGLEILGINGNPRGQTYLSKHIQTPQFIYFNGLLPCPLEGSLSKTLLTQRP
jgi:hypothetical protein